ncbi:MAG: leucine-rich repeat domain-containing protein [Bacteroidaceae bacterium]|nr:leucine-rich repeat domain-containing protein [Bacteroidaceae bacterium]
MIANIDRLTYFLDEEKKCATVTKSLEPYSGEIVIPATVEYEGEVYPVTDILDEAFAGCAQLVSVSLGENIESVGIGAFEGCSMLAKVLFPASLHVIGMQAFKGCTLLKEVVLPANVIVIGKSAFAGCTALERAFLSDNLINIEPSLFDGCAALRLVTMG